MEGFSKHIIIGVFLFSESFDRDRFVSRGQHQIQTNVSHAAPPY
jgi:hypothetical protein